MHLRNPFQTFTYKYYGATHLRVPYQKYFYNFDGSPHLRVPYQKYFYIFDSSPHLSGLFDTIEQQIICEDFWFFQSSRAAEYL
jgi:hypothetical protein